MANMTHTLAGLAALLHDVGKFAQRAGAAASKNLEQEYCPSGKTHTHVLYTDYFIEHILPLPPELEGERSHLARLASAHHRPDRSVREEDAISQADGLSSGGDRQEGDAGGTYKTARLESVFAAVRMEGVPVQNKENAEDIPRYPLAALDDYTVAPLFPVRVSKRGNDKGADYAALYARFCAALRDIPLDMGVDHYRRSLSTVLERFTWCIPSSTYRTKADISLYDHATTTAAIAQALLACPQGKESFLLFGADISGIQKFIFGSEEDADKGAGKLLRARSFLLQMLTRSVWLVLLDRLGLQESAKIMDAGGRFVLLLPHTDAVLAACTALEDEVQDFLLTRYQGALRMNCAVLPLHKEDLKRKRFTVCYDAFNDLLEHKKLHPFARAFAKGASPVRPVDHAGYATFGECPLCAMRPAGTHTLEDVPVCEACWHLVTQVGRRLPKARYAVITRGGGEGLPLFDQCRLYLGEDTPSASAKTALDILALRERRAFSAVPIAGYTPSITTDDMRRWQAEGRLRSEAGQLLLEGELCQEGAPKTFAMLAQESRIPCSPKGMRSIACLAACKADVDNLGMLFSVGFGTGENNRFSISRFAMLSRMMHHFFASHLIHVIEEDFPNIYVVYAGGDDLFVLGSWAEVVQFSARLHTDFTAFAGGAAGVSLSAGLPVVKPRLPLRALRNAAEEALEQAKHCPGKNAASLFDVIAPWPWMLRLLERGQWLEQLCLDGKVTQGFVRRLLGYAREAHAFVEHGDMRKGLFRAHVTYDMARNCANMPAEDYSALQDIIAEKDFPSFVLCATWALYRTRTTA